MRLSHLPPFTEGRPGDRDRQIERDLGLYQGAIRRWRDELEADPIDAFPGTGHQKPLEEESRCLRRELDIAREERAGIMEHEGGMTLEEAEARALEMLDPDHE